ncbi:MAG: glycosyltransferase, partial [Anaerolineae bacterium]
RGGAELLLLRLIPYLQARGFELSVGFSTPGPLEDDFRALGVPLYPLPRRFRLDPLLAWRMFRLARRLRPDVVHTHLFKSDFFGRPAARLAGVPVVVSTLHSADPWARNPLFGWLYGFTARFADRLIAVSDTVRAYHLRYTAARPSRVLTIENGVDVARFENVAAEGRALRRTLGIPPDALVLGTIGRLVPDKGQAYFLQAAARLRNRFPQARFLIVGDGPDDVALRALAERLNLADAVTFTGFRQDIPALLGAMDVLVMPSLREGLPLTLLEALAAGVPVVATDTGGVRALLGEEAGLVVPPADVAALVAACERLLSDEALRERLGARGRSLVQTRYSLRRTADRLAALYLELAEGRGVKW